MALRVPKSTLPQLFKDGYKVSDDGFDAKKASR